MNENNQTDGLHRSSSSGLRVYMELNRIFTTKDTLTIENTGCTVHACASLCVCVCVYTLLLQSYHNL